ncbi:TPM domain-containing protein [Chitinibacter sp. SCUT-21]|uniref:TPM domain-containing protein n=1 Tax=Chitinibacter sp. SCUT-21 TaxID=2970891 RepID=UPI0035A71308
MNRSILFGLGSCAVLLSSMWFLHNQQKPSPATFSAESEPIFTQSTLALKSHIIDKADFIPVVDIPRFEQYMSWILRESGIDVRMVFLPNMGNKPIETLAVDLMSQMQIGKQTGQQRGILLLYDVQGQRLKVEVGYGLEAVFPDVFVNYLVEKHTKTFFASGDVSLGLRLMLRLLQHRMREAVIGNDFDPRTISIASELPHLSGGAGVKSELEVGTTRNKPVAQPNNADALPPGPSPTIAYQTYLTWLSTWPLNSNAGFLTTESRQYLASLPTSPAYAEYIFLSEYGKQFKVIERGDLALLYFTDTPFVSPHFFIQTDGVWQMDLMAEVRNTREHSGGEYTWAYHGDQDKYTYAFQDLLITVEGYRRIKDGDNRPLVIRGDH